LADQVCLGRNFSVELGALLDPARDDVDLRLRQRLAALLWRHATGAFIRNPVNDLAFFGFSGFYRVFLVAAFAEVFVTRHVELALALLGVVAREAILFEDWGHVVDETHRLGLLGLDRWNCEQHQRQGKTKKGAQHAKTVMGALHCGTPGWDKAKGGNLAEPSVRPAGLDVTTL